MRGDETRERQESTALLPNKRDGNNMLTVNEDTTKKETSDANGREKKDLPTGCVVEQTLWLKLNTAPSWDAGHADLGRRLEDEATRRRGGEARRQGGKAARPKERSGIRKKIKIKR